MADVTITIPNNVALEALAAVEKTWKADATRILSARSIDYDSLSNLNKMRACLAAMVRVSVKNDRRAEAERNAALAATEPDVE